MNKKQRDKLKQKFGGKCAYCGILLTDRWHVDHLVPVLRNTKYVSGKGFVCDGTMHRPENDNTSNLMPACAPCNIDKHSMSLDSWRSKLADAANVLRRNSPTYRHALRFGLIAETGVSIVFYFELLASEEGKQ